jgi:hypothetical protein
MATVVGFDFGTHQTKVCIANNDDPRNVTHFFLPFHNQLSGEDSCVFPSFVQINENHTLSYGWADERNCMMAANPALAPAALPRILEKPSEPVMPVQPIPPEPFTREMAIQLIANVNHERKMRGLGKKKRISLTDENIERVIAIKTKEQETRYREQLAQWGIVCKQKRQDHIRKCAQVDSHNESARQNYERQVEESKVLKPQRYSNFKSFAFLGQETKNLLSANQVSLFYITYIVFLLEQRYGQDFSIQFGVPASPSTYKAQRRLATQFLVRAIQLVEEVFHNDLDKFLNSTYEDLLALSCLPIFSEEEKEKLGIIILPEASACLTSIVSSGKLTNGKLHLLMDIGGGTTDISFLAVNKNKPIIYWFWSVPLGLNFIREHQDNITKYKAAISDAVNQLKKELVKDFSETNQPLSYLEDSLYGNILVYNGGGSSEKRLCVQYSYFKTIRRISDILPIDFHQRNLIGLNHILSNAYGLSYQVDDENLAIKLQPFNLLLNGYKEQVKEAKSVPDHHYKYEHGLSEWD